MASATPKSRGKKRRNPFEQDTPIVAKQTNLSDSVHSRENRQSSELLALNHVRVFAMRRPKPTCVINENWLVHNVTSTSKEKWCLEFSPFFLGPIELYPDEKTGQMYVAKNMENAWQFAKVYPQHANAEDQSPTDAYWKWAENGWNDAKPHRFPLGRRALKPLYSLWDGKRLNYIEARRTIYAPLYAKYVEQTDAYRKLKSIYEKYCCGDKTSKEARPMALVDFDGWDYLGQGYRLEQVIDMPEPKMGHAFIIVGLLENNLFWLSEPEKSRLEHLRTTGQLLRDI